MKISICLILIAVAATSALRCFPVSKLCEGRPNRVYSDCAPSSDCVRTCMRPFEPCGGCSEDCNPGCVCKEGYVENNNSECIKKEDCFDEESMLCQEEHKIYHNCYAQQKCQPTCENPSQGRPCVRCCEAGCICEDGYVEDANRNCILVEDCPVLPVDPAICLLPQVTGLCEAYMPSWGYNTKTGNCTEFIYGGCGGNANRFITKEECSSTCM